MKRKQFSEEQIIGILKEAEEGRGGNRALPQARHVERDLLCMEGQVRRVEVSDAKRLRSLEEENARLKRLLADTMLDNASLKDLLSKE